MATITLNDGTVVPSIAFGIGTAFFGKEAHNAVELALNTGFTHLDGAQVYANEDSIAKGLAASGKPRSEVFIVTKLFPGSQPDRVRPSLEESLQKIGVDYVDLFLVHAPVAMRPDQPNPNLVDLWKEVEAVHAAGLAKSIGVSNFRVQDLEAFVPTATIKPSVNQLEFHPYVWKAVEPIIKYGRENGNITPASYGGLTPLVRATGGPVDAVVASIADRLKITPGQVLGKWILQKGAILVTTSSKEERLKEYLKTPEVPDLTDEDIKAIEEAGSKQHTRYYMKQVFGDA
ncbi:Aldo-ket-red domain-containing protein [Mycena indigotica]|uniref:Aldo-ket-red domain-containing protein n=1 Tax=Mycena indigotica TaxID=2126181 RepID=A0A8H6S9V4_9AGAR|nr:Aldo-ket-red domain-containing protein [Mycena indigotica]KAF7294791.1 Aldo-ket-red domain-containing protein [Mycena indigotica]